VTDKHSNPGVMAPKIGDPWNPVDDSRVWGLTHPIAYDLADITPPMAHTKTRYVPHGQYHWQNRWKILHKMLSSWIHKYFENCIYLDKNKIYPKIQDGSIYKNLTWYITSMEWRRKTYNHLKKWR
jgi:hypothetical protein